MSFLVSDIFNLSSVYFGYLLCEFFKKTFFFPLYIFGDYVILNTCNSKLIAR